MSIERRTFVAGAAALAVAGSALGAGTARASATYGLIGKMTAKPGQRDALIAAIVRNGEPMPGCLSYIVATDPTSPDLIWITEAWESREAHAASLSLPSVQQAITKGRPLIADMESIAETMPVGGFGLGTPDRH